MESKSEEVAIPEQFAQFVDAAVLRLTYLYPGVRFLRSDGAVTAMFEVDIDADDLRKQIAHTLYREKIYQETLELRRRAFRALY